MTLPVIVSYANYGYLQFSENLLRNAQDVLKNHTLVLYCLDRQLFDALQKYVSDSIQLVLYENNNAGNGYYSYNSGGFSKLTHIKVNILSETIKKYGFVHFVDGDVVFCKEPTEEYYAKYSDYDIVYQRDAPPPNQPFHPWTCTGNLILRNTERTHAFLLALSEYQTNYPAINDQGCQMKLFEASRIVDIRTYPHARLTEFPDTEFTCGYYVRENLFDFGSIMVFHANHVTGADAKVGLLRKIGKWYM